MSEDVIFKIDVELIETFSGAKYERRGETLYSLNYAEPGMWGNAMGKIIPTDLAKRILEKYRKEQHVANSLNFRKSKSKTLDSKVSEPNAKETKINKKELKPKAEVVVRKTKTTTSVKLFKKVD